MAACSHRRWHGVTVAAPINIADGGTKRGRLRIEPVRLGLVGAGNVGTKHVHAAQNLPEVRFVGVHDTKHEVADTLGRRHGIPVFDSVAEMVELAGVEAVVVAVPTSSHAEVAVEAAKLRIHALVEKPMATTIPDCDAMIEAARASGVIVGVCHMMQRRHKRLQVAKEVIDSGALGAIVMMSCRRTANYVRHGRSEWMFDPAIAGGGVMLNTGTYAIEEFQWLADSTVRRVSSVIPRSAGGTSVETDGAALLELDRGIMASIVELGTGHASTEELDISLERGSLRLSHADGLWQYEGGTGTQLVEPSRPPRADYQQAMSYQLADFALAVRQGHPPATDGTWGRSVVAAAAAIYRSARTGCPEPVTGFAG